MRVEQNVSFLFYFFKDPPPPEWFTDVLTDYTMNMFPTHNQREEATYRIGFLYRYLNNKVDATCGHAGDISPLVYFYCMDYRIVEEPFLRKIYLPESLERNRRRMELLSLPLNFY